MAEVIPVEIDATRVCDAIAHIGYSPAAALMDIVDNSVTAEAKTVTIRLAIRSGATFAEKNNVESYSVLDDGNGMDDKDVLNALKLGSLAAYGPNSLSKYGLGLKSAGFSLGRRIAVFSKKAGQISSYYYVDKGVIAANAGKYVVTRAPAAEAPAEMREHLAKLTSGTIVQISGCESIDQHSAKKTIDSLTERLGVVYYGFLKGAAPLGTITIQCTGKPDVQVKPFDILFTDDAKAEGFDKDKYDCKSPYIVFDDKIASKTKGTPDIPLQVTIFPQHKMSGHQGFGPEEQKRIRGYRISRENKGFFIYRNGRLIRWGDDLGLVGKDELGFRAKLTIETAHDDLLHVDVSKQRMSIPEDILNGIETAIRIPLRDSRAAFEACREKLDADNPEAAQFNVKNADLVEEDPDEPEGEERQKAARQRKNDLAKATKERLKADHEPEPRKPNVVEELPLFEKVRYSANVSAAYLWDTGFDPVNGTFVRINKNHAFYRTVLDSLEPGSGARQALEALIWCCAAGENKTIQNLEVETALIDRVLSRFKKVLASCADTWSGANQDLFDND